MTPSDTDPNEVEEFVNAHRCGFSLAIAIGTSHGAYQVQGRAPDAVRHPGGGFPPIFPTSPSCFTALPPSCPSMWRSSTSTAARWAGAQGRAPRICSARPLPCAVCKINIDTDLRLAMTASIRKYSGGASRSFRSPPIPGSRPGCHSGSGGPQDEVRPGLLRQSLRRAVPAPISPHMLAVSRR